MPSIKSAAAPMNPQKSAPLSQEPLGGASGRREFAFDIAAGAFGPVSGPHRKIDLRAVQPAQLAVFVLAARSPSFSEAARCLGLTQSAVSQAVDRLERLLDVRLFDRTVRPPRLTQRGEEILAPAQDVVSESQRFLRAVEAILTGQIRSLRFGITEGAASYASSEIEAALLPMVENFDAQWGLIPKIVQDFHEGRFDVAVAPDIPAEDRSLARMLVSERYLIVYPKTERIDADMLPPEQLFARLTLPFVSSRHESLDWRRSQAMLRILGLSVHRRIVMENTQSATNAVCRGLGWTILPPMSLWSIRDSLQDVTVHLTGTANIEKTLWAAARTTTYIPVLEKIASVYRKMLKEKWLPDLVARKPVLGQFVHVGADD